MIASLPWYDVPRLVPAWEQLWAVLRDALRYEGVEAPDALTWPDDLPAHWRDPDLALSMACGLDVATRMRDVLQPVAALSFDLRGAAPGAYRSCIVVREGHPARTIDDVLGLRLAANDPYSWSGAGCLRAAFGPLDEAFAEVRFLGSHIACCDAVRDGESDVAAVDVVTWASLGRARNGLTLAGVTARAPSPPIVIRADADPAPVLRALAATWQSTDSEAVRSALRLDGFVPATEATYRMMAPFGPVDSAS